MRLCRSRVQGRRMPTRGLLQLTGDPRRKHVRPAASLFGAAGNPRASGWAVICFLWCICELRCGTYLDGVWRTCTKRKCCGSKLEADTCVFPPKPSVVRVRFALAASVAMVAGAPDAWSRGLRCVTQGHREEQRRVHPNRHGRESARVLAVHLRDDVDGRRAQDAVAGGLLESGGQVPR